MVTAPNSLLTDGSRTYVRTLMARVSADQRWGVPYGLPAGTRVGVKNGWLPRRGDTSNWQINSIGYVAGSHRRYEVAVLTAHNGSYDDGIATVQAVTTLVWHYIARDW
jgi:hypothetical protein